MFHTTLLIETSRSPPLSPPLAPFLVVYYALPSSLMLQICTCSKTLLYRGLISVYAETVTWAFTSS